MKEVHEILHTDEDIRTRMTQALHLIVSAADATRASIMQVHDKWLFPRRFQYPADVVTSELIEHFGKLSVEELGITRILEDLKKDIIVAGPISDFESKEREFAERNGAKSVLFAPLISEHGNLWGILEITDHRTEREWHPAIKDTISTLTHEISKEIARSELQPMSSTTDIDVIELQLKQELMAAELEEINRWKDHVLSSFSHEFQTPLYTLLGFSKTLIENEELDGDEEIRHTCLHHIYEQSRRLEKLVNNMMFASRLHTKSIETNMYRIDLRNVFNSVKMLMEEKLEGSGVDFFTELPDASVMMKCDPEQIERMIQHILENAVNNTPSPGWISLKVQPEKDDIILMISDTGAGISEDRINRIFEPFYSAPGKGTSEAGVGLGLSIAKEIVDLHNGFITVQSTEGEGTVFTIVLPRNLGESVSPIR